MQKRNRRRLRTGYPAYRLTQKPPRQIARCLPQVSEFHNYPANQQIEYKISRLKDALHAASTAGNKLGYDHFTFLVSSVFFLFCFVHGESKRDLGLA